MIIKNLDLQIPSRAVTIFPLIDGVAPQWEGYDPDTPPDRGQPTGGVTLGTPGSLPTGFSQAARFDPPKDPTVDTTNMKPRSECKLSKSTVPDPAFLATTGHVAADYGVTVWMDAAEGLTRWYHWKTYFPSDFRIPTSDDLPKIGAHAPTAFQFWHGASHDGDPNVPNVQYHVKRYPGRTDPMKILVRYSGGRSSKNVIPTTWTYEGSQSGPNSTAYTETDREYMLVDPLVLDHWYTFIVGVDWSATPSTGRIRIWVDGTQVVDSLTTTPVEIPHGWTSSTPPNGGAGLPMKIDGVTPSQLFAGQAIYMPDEGKKTTGYDLTRDNPYDRVLWGLGFVIGETQQDVTDYGGTGGGGGGSSSTIIRAPEFAETWTLTGAVVDTFVRGPEFTETWDLGAQDGMHAVTVYRREGGVLKQLFGSKRTGGVLHGVTPTQFIDVGDDQ